MTEGNERTGLTVQLSTQIVSLKTNSTTQRATSREVTNIVQITRDALLRSRDHHFPILSQPDLVGMAYLSSAIKLYSQNVQQYY